MFTKAEALAKVTDLIDRFEEHLTLVGSATPAPLGEVYHQAR